MSLSRRILTTFLSFVVCNLFGILGIWFLGFATPAYAQVPQSWDNGRCVVQGDVATIQGFECLFYNILQVIISLAGVAFFIMFITGGFQYMMSQNDPKAVATASSTLTLAIVGVVGVIASFFILRLIAQFTGISSILLFKIPGP